MKFFDLEINDCLANVAKKKGGSREITFFTLPGSTVCNGGWAYSTPSGIQGNLITCFYDGKVKTEPLYQK